MKTYWESKGIAPPNLTSATVVGEWPASSSGRFTSGEDAPGYPLESLGGAQSQSGRYGVQKNIFLLRESNHSGTAHSPSCRMSYHGSVQFYINPHSYFDVVARGTVVG
jgi:hypothetical protein